MKLTGFFFHRENQREINLEKAIFFIQSRFMAEISFGLESLHFKKNQVKTKHE
jgi:hypothetical protein